VIVRSGNVTARQRPSLSHLPGNLRFLDSVIEAHEAVMSVLIHHAGFASQVIEQQTNSF